MDGPFSNFIEKACKEPESVDINFDKFNESYVSKVLSNIDNISEHDLSVIIKNNMERFTEDVLNGDESYAHLLSNKKNMPKSHHNTNLCLVMMQLVRPCLSNVKYCHS